MAQKEVVARIERLPVSSWQVKTRVIVGTATTPEEAVSLQHARVDVIAASGFEKLGVMAHNLKGTGGSYELPELTRMGAGLENSAKQTDTGALGLQLRELKEYLDRVQLFADV